MRYQIEVYFHRMLVSDPNYDRDNPSKPTQRARWKALLYPGGPFGMSRHMFNYGVNVLMTYDNRSRADAEKLVLIPDWSKTSKWQPMDVDHIVELQLLTPLDRSSYDNFRNYELLDSSANSSSGSKLYWNVLKEQRLAFAVTRDRRYINERVVFDAVLMQYDTAAGERWTIDEIRTGQHIEVLLDMYGIRDHEPGGPEEREDEPEE